EALGRPAVYVFGFFAGNDLIESLTYDARSHEAAPGPQSPARDRILALNRLVNMSAWLKRLSVLQLMKAAAVRMLSRDLVGIDPMLATARDASGVFGRDARASFARPLDRLDAAPRDRRLAVVCLLIPARYEVCP